MAEPMREGFWKESFWKESFGEDVGLPLPVPHDEPWDGQTEFLSALVRLEDRLMSEWKRFVDAYNTAEDRFSRRRLERPFHVESYGGIFHLSSL